MSVFYGLDDAGEPVQMSPPDAGAFWDDRRRKIARDELPGGVVVSTVFIVIDHSFGDGPPVLWETLVFGGPLNEEQERYTSRADALAGHADMVRRCREAMAG